MIERKAGEYYRAAGIPAALAVDGTIRETQAFRADVFTAAPRRTATEEVGHGVVVADQCRAHVEFHVYRPRHAHLLHLLQGYSAQLTVSQRFPFPCFFIGKSGVIFRITQ